ncbi:hypothetical protein B0J14DRAFT_540799 [Halenospora varia]|nr:hypothetical protein B0J14DRAFT_540799 [Halenospora varia]
MKDIIEPTGISILSEGWSSSSASASSSSSSSDRASSTSRTDFDIVAVHGLFGQGFDSWTGGKEQIWLKDMLPRKLPDARIMAFAYDHNSTTRKSFSASSISEIALDLLDSLGSKRTTEKDQERPIIFIAHELGGIIVKQVNFQSSQFLQQLTLLASR